MRNWQVAAETLQRCKEKVGCAPKNGRKFTRVRTDGTNRKCEQSTEPEKTAESLRGAERRYERGGGKKDERVEDERAEHKIVIKKT